MEDKNFISDLDGDEGLEILEAIKKAQEQYKKLLTDNAFTYFLLWQNLSPPPSPRGIGRVKAFPSPSSGQSD